MSRRIAVYPGSFDPFHNGHLDIVQRCRPIFDEVVVGVLSNVRKGAPVFSVSERVEMIRELVAPFGECRVESFSGLLVDFMDQVGARTLVRGLRAVSDAAGEEGAPGLEPVGGGAEREDAPPAHRAARRSRRKGTRPSTAAITGTPAGVSGSRHIDRPCRLRSKAFTCARSAASIRSTISSSSSVRVATPMLTVTDIVPPPRLGTSASWMRSA